MEFESNALDATSRLVIGKYIRGFNFFQINSCLLGFFKKGFKIFKNG